jgi:nitric oxide reductase large subunit
MFYLLMCWMGFCFFFLPEVDELRCDPVADDLRDTLTMLILPLFIVVVVVAPATTTSFVSSATLCPYSYGYGYGYGCYWSIIIFFSSSSCHEWERSERSAASPRL